MIVDVDSGQVLVNDLVTVGADKVTHTFKSDDLTLKPQSLQVSFDADLTMYCRP